MAKKTTPAVVPIMPFVVISVIAMAAWLILSNRSSSSPKTTAQPTTQDQSATTSGTKMFKSSGVMNFSIEVPSEYEVEEKSLMVILRKNQSEITISRSGTNFNSLDEYMPDHRSKNKLLVKKSDEMKINNLDAIVEVLETVTKEQLRSYKLYVDHYIYTIATNQIDFYSDLDQIAQSFRVTK